MYSQLVTRETYARVTALVRAVATMRYTAIADAMFLRRWQRDLLRGVAADLDVPFVIIACSAPDSTLRQRVSRRLEQGDDASEATVDVLDEQLLNRDAFAADDRPFVVPCEAITPERCMEAARAGAGRIAATV
jgi:uncharacterized protein